MPIPRPPFAWQAFEEQLLLFLPCVHLRAEPRRKTIANGREHFRLQCPDCGKPVSGPLSAQTVEPWQQAFGHLKPWDDRLERRWSEQRRALADVVKSDPALQRAGAWWDAYEAYVAGPEWKRKRARVLARSGGICENCGVRPAKLLHHTTYERVGRELESDLLAVCVPCHQGFHPARPRCAAL